MNRTPRFPCCAVARRLLSSIVGTLALLLTAGLAAAQTTITIKGSDSMLGLSRQWTQGYAKVDPSLRFAVEGDGSETGIRALLQGETDIAASSRAMTVEELETFQSSRDGRRPLEVVVAQDGIHVYVHTSNAVSRLTLDQLSRILTGQVRNWSDVGGADRRIDLYNRNDDSGTRTFLQNRLLGRRSFSDRALDVPSSAQLMAAVASNPRAIGYSGAIAERGARTLRIAADSDTTAVRATVDTVGSGTYPLSRPLYYYVAPDAESPALGAFLDWVLSPVGQRIATFAGFFPAPGRGIAAPETAEPIPAPEVDPDAVVRLTPESMAEHGFRLAVTIAGDDRARPRAVTVIFSPRGEAILRARSIQLRLGADAEVPLALAEDLSLGFALREPLIHSATLVLRVATPAGELRTYEVRLDDFRS